MAQMPLLERVARLEFRVTALERLPDDIAELGARMTAAESQILELRQEMHVGFLAVSTRFDEQGQRMLALHKEVMATIDEKWRHTLVMHEDLVDRIKTIGEHLAPAGARGSSRKTVRRQR